MGSVVAKGVSKKGQAAWEKAKPERESGASRKDTVAKPRAQGQQ